MMECVGSQVGVFVKTRIHSSITPTDSASSAAPGLGSVLSRCAFTSTACPFATFVLFSTYGMRSSVLRRLEDFMHIIIVPSSFMLSTSCHGRPLGPSFIVLFTLSSHVFSPFELQVGNIIEDQLSLVCESAIESVKYPQSCRHRGMRRCGESVSIEGHRACMFRPESAALTLEPPFNIFDRSPHRSTLFFNDYDDELEERDDGGALGTS